MIELVIPNARGGEQRHALQQREYVLGRDPDVHIPLQDRKVSRRHARIFRQGSQYWIEDLGSANGVLLSGEPIRGPLGLQGGMELSIGPFQLVIIDDTQPQHQADTYALVGVGPPFEGQRFVLPVGTVQVGRTEGNAIVIADGSVSRKQATLTVGGPSVIIEDHGSSNGTWVNEVQITRRVLAHGDRVRFGNIAFQFVHEGEGGVDFGGIRRLADRFVHADRSIQIAAGIAALSVVLLIVTLAVIAHRRGGGDRATGTLEEAYDARLQVGLSMAEHFIKRGEWDAAARSFRELLSQDPINPDARRGLIEARRHKKYESALRAAEQDLAMGLPQNALYRVAEIPADGYYATQAAQLRARASTVLANDSLARAQQACQGRDWQRCHAEAVVHMQYKPDSIDGRGLIQQSEREMHAHGVAFTPWGGTSAVDSPALDLAARWQNERVRIAAEKYAAGSLTLATETLESVKSQASAQELATLLTRFGEAKTRGDGAAVGGNIDLALQAWDQALRIDAQIVPASYPSVFRQAISERVSGELYERGKAAFDRGVYGDAFGLWQRALEKAPDNARVAEGLESLETRAASLLASVGENGSCRVLEDVMSMTRPASRTHQEASQRARKCPR
ncbi:MAG: FHA domain-containing protein [Myxococcota bacterium]